MDVSHIFGCNKVMTPQSLATLAERVALHLAAIREPWTPATEVPRGRSKAPRPHAPVRLDAVDLEVSCERTLRYVIADVCEAMGDAAPPRPRTNSTAVDCARWFYRYASTVAHWLAEPDVLDLQTIDEKLKHHHGAATSRDEAALRVAATRSAAGLPADHVDDAKTIAHLATLQGHPVHRQSISRWGRNGTISVVEPEGSGPRQYYLTEVIEHLVSTTTKEKPMTADRDIVTVYGRTNCVACRATSNRLDKYGVEYAYVDLDEHQNMAAIHTLAEEAGGTALPIVVVDHPERPRTVWSGLNIEKINELATITTNDVAGAA